MKLSFFLLKHEEILNPKKLSSLCIHRTYTQSIKINRILKLTARSRFLFFQRTTSRSRREIRVAVPPKSIWNRAHGLAVSHARFRLNTGPKRSHSIYTGAYLRRECTRHPVYACTANPTTYGPVLGEEVAVGPGCPAASAAEMKELIYLPESYNSLSTCIRTPSTPCQTLLAGLALFHPLSLSLSFSSSPHRLPRSALSLLPSLPPLRPYRPYLNFSPHLPPSVGRRDYSPFALSAPFSHRLVRA